MKRLFTCEEVAQRYHVKAFTVWNWIKRKKLRAIRPGKQYLIPEPELERLEKLGQDFLR
ncbi:MAG: helix-turn-helix domain-containing protein [Oscillospiraceae bacterium]